MRIDYIELVIAAAILLFYNFGDNPYDLYDLIYNLLSRAGDILQGFNR